MVPAVRPRVQCDQASSTAELLRKDLDARNLHDVCRRILCMAQRVKKTTGGRAWLPKWGLTGAPGRGDCEHELAGGCQASPCRSVLPSAHPLRLQA